VTPRTSCRPVSISTLSTGEPITVADPITVVERPTAEGIVRLADRR
jgi:hypothetical protein